MQILTPTKPSQPETPVSPKQAEFIEALRSLKYRFMLFGGGTGGGKSWLGAQLIVNLALTQPNTSYGVFRKNLTTLRRTTYRTFQKYMRKHHLIEGVHFTVNNQSGITWTFKNGSTIDFIELDITKDPELNKLGGLELTAAMIDEADEVAEKAFNTLRFRIGRNNFNGEKSFIYLTCNPNQTWVKRMFYDPAMKGELKAPFYFLESLITDNPFQSSEALEAAADPTAPKQYVERYFKGNWNYVQSDNAIIQLVEFEYSFVEVLPPTSVESFVGFDPTREGDDIPALARWDGGVLADFVAHEVPDELKTDAFDYGAFHGQFIIDYCTSRGIPASNVAIDGVGNGGSVIDYCNGKGFFVRTYKSGFVDGIEQIIDPNTPEDKHGNRSGSKKYDNIRSQSYWNMCRELAARTRRVFEDIPFRDEFQKDLLAHTFTTNDKMLIVESKEKVKKILGRSPDFSDAAEMGYWVSKLPRSGGVILSGRSYKDILRDGRR
jgi:phage terminase large subunit